ncbi:MAG: acetyl-CoA carboxylase biotin carboxyl carrier protein subunit [Bacteroidota bacterium]|nr:acetyl-CoA carboxylase biotin carboxyl carrier protein subunit [Bacteroidota bacterium]
MKEYRFKINGKDYKVAVNGISGNIADVTVNDVPYQVELDEAQAAAAPAPAAAPVQAAAPAAPAAAPKAAPKAAGAGAKVNSPMEGNVVDVCVKAGDSVKSGQKLVVIEAMKMEVEISATADGTVSEVLVNKGDHLVEGQPVATIA